MPRADYRLCFVVGPSSTGQAPWLDVLARALDGGVTCVQLREKECSEARLVDLANEALLLCRDRAVPLLINDSVTAAGSCSAAGVHLGQSDVAWQHARQRLGPDALVGLTVESTHDAEQAEEALVDYLGVSSIFPTRTKCNIRHIWGLTGIRALRKTSSLPLMAIGGIDETNAGSVIRAGADGVAVVSCLARTADPTATARRLRDSVDAVLAEKHRTGGCHE